jgi:hypothetical protein
VMNSHRLILAVGIALSLGMIGSCSEEENASVIGTTPGVGGTPTYQCRQPVPVDAASVWPIPPDTEVTTSGVGTKRLRKGDGRTPVAGSGQVLILCVTYYDRNGAVVQHDPVVVHDIDLPPKEWQEVLTRMSEREVRRFWIPPRGHVKDVVIGDFEMQPYPLPEDPRRKPPR